MGTKLCEVMCLECENVSTRKEDYIDLSVNFPLDDKEVPDI